MTNSLALWLFGIIAVVLVVDAAVLGWDIHVVFMRLLVELIDWIAFWR